MLWKNEVNLQCHLLSRSSNSVVFQVGLQTLLACIAFDQLPALLLSTWFLLIFNIKQEVAMNVFSESQEKCFLSISFCSLYPLWDVHHPNPSWSLVLTSLSFLLLYIAMSGFLSCPGALLQFPVIFQPCSIQFSTNWQSSCSHHACLSFLLPCAAPPPAM